MDDIARHKENTDITRLSTVRVVNKNKQSRNCLHYTGELMNRLQLVLDVQLYIV